MKILIASHDLLEFLDGTTEKPTIPVTEDAAQKTECLFKKEECTVAVGVRIDKLYCMKFKRPERFAGLSVQEKNIESNPNMRLWNERLAHQSMYYLKNYLKG